MCVQYNFQGWKIRPISCVAKKQTLCWTCDQYEGLNFYAKKSHKVLRTSL